MWYDYQYDNCPLIQKLTTLGHRRSTIWTITTKSIKKNAKVNICYRNNYSLEHNSSITQEVIIACLHLFDICMTVCSCSIVNKHKQKQTNKYYTKKRVGKSQNINALYKSSKTNFSCYSIELFQNKLQNKLHSLLVRTISKLTTQHFVDFSSKVFTTTMNELNNLLFTSYLIYDSKLKTISP